MKTLQQNDTQVYSSYFYFQFVNIESVPLQSTGASTKKRLFLISSWDFKHCFWRHSTNFFLNLFLFLHKFPKKRKTEFLKKKYTFGFLQKKYIYQYL